MAYPKLPEQAQSEFDDAARRYTMCIHTREYDTALAIIKDLRDKMLRWQEIYGERFHKGYPIHSIGYTLYLQKKYEDALGYFILAYIEDLLSTDVGKEDEADSTPAGRTLLLGYRLTPESLRVLKEMVTDLKNAGRIPLTPEEVLQQFDKTKRIYQNLQASAAKEHREYPSRRFTIFESDWEKRVFIGGSGDAMIDYMRDQVDSIGDYDPIVATDFDMPNGMTIYQKCIALLHCCQYAIFELSNQGGQLIEIERAPDYGVKTLVVWQADKENKITQMLRSCLDDRGIRHESYTKFQELEGIFRKFLQHRVSE